MKLVHQAQSQRVDVWVNPAAGQDASAVAEALSEEFHVVVVPRTGTRQVKVAVLCDPTPTEVRRVRHILRGARIVAATSKEPGAALRAALRRSGARVLACPSAQELSAAVRGTRLAT